MNYFQKFFGHLRTITKHKFTVMKYCFKLGLYWQGLVHDNSKYGPTEFFSSVKYYSGTRSPIDAEKEDIGYSLAWQHHKGHNPHHWEGWIDNIGPRPFKTRTVYETSLGEKMPIEATIMRSNPDALEIPINYALEMICDWIGAGKVYMKDKWTESAPIEYYKKCRENRLLHPNTDWLLTRVQEDIERLGIKNTFYRLKHCYGIYYMKDETRPEIKSWKQARKIQYKK